MDEDEKKGKSKFVGNYEVLKTIGEGSFAKVKLAIHKLTGANVAIKIIDKTRIVDEYASKNIHREAQIMRSVSHPNIIQLFEVMENKKNLYLILEYASGGELLDYIVSKGKLKETEAKEFVRQIASALSNEFETIRYRVLISDFGLSNIYDEEKLLSTCCGSPVYSAPELIEGKKYLGPEVDCWSLGINIYAMVVGDLPFADSNLTALQEAILRGKYVIPDYISPECKNLISKLLVVNPKKRLTMEQVNDHIWLNNGASFLEAKEVAESMQPKSEAELKAPILNQLEQMGFDKNSATESILQRKFNQAAGTYLLLLWQEKQGKGEKNNNLLDRNDQEVIGESNEKSNAHNNVTSSELATVLFELERAQNDTCEKEKKKDKPKRSSKPVNKRLVNLKKSTDEDTKLMENKTHAHEKELRLPPIGNLDANKLQPADALGILDTARHSVKPKKGYKIGKIPIDESLYLPKEQDFIPGDINIGAMGMPRTIKFASNCTAATQMAPDLFFEKLRAALEKNEIDWFHDGYFCECIWGDIKIEAEICKMPRLSSFGVRFKRIYGDIWEFKKLCTKITNDLESL